MTTHTIVMMMWRGTEHICVNECRPTSNELGKLSKPRIRSQTAISVIFAACVVVTAQIQLSNVAYYELARLAISEAGIATSSRVRSWCIAGNQASRVETAGPVSSGYVHIFYSGIENVSSFRLEYCPDKSHSVIRQSQHADSADEPEEDVLATAINRISSLETKRRMWSPDSMASRGQSILL